MTSASEIEYSLTVEFCYRQGSKIVWTLMSKGFKEGEYIYIYRNSKRITAGHCIKNPASPIVIDSWEASLFEDVSKQEEYHFRYLNFDVWARALFCNFLCICPLPSIAMRHLSFVIAFAVSTAQALYWQGVLPPNI